MTVAILDDEKRVSASITAGADMYTTILAFVIAFLGLVMIGRVCDHDKAGIQFLDRPRRREAAGAVRF
jgi:hypothetical protein